MGVLLLKSLEVLIKNTSYDLVCYHPPFAMLVFFRRYSDNCMVLCYQWLQDLPYLVDADRVAAPFEGVLGCVKIFIVGVSRLSCNFGGCDLNKLINSG
eukprot:TsM_000311500 transcript=TsM_000311500 gene=TsM_000311500